MSPEVGLINLTRTRPNVDFPQPDSPTAVAFTVAAKNIAAQCSIQHYRMQEEAEAEAKWDRLSSEERQKILVGFLDEANYNIAPEDENKTWAELEQEIQAAIIQHLFGESKIQTTPTTS